MSLVAAVPFKRFTYILLINSSKMNAYLYLLTVGNIRKNLNIPFIFRNKNYRIRASLV